MKKKFVRPQIQVEVIEDINEPVYMACSGSNLFSVSVSDYTHQEYETGRYDDRCQVNAEYHGAPYVGDLYMTATFEKPVNIKTLGWGFQPYLDERGSYTVVAVKRGVNLNGVEDIGFGDLIVELESGGTAGDTAGIPKISFSFNPNGCA